MRPFVILDRDGVINQDSVDYIRTPDEWTPIPGSLEAIALLTRHGFDTFVATNQAGIARGKFGLEDLAAIHNKMLGAVRALGGEIKDIVYCPHGPDDNCDCRKPRPGLLTGLASTHDLSLMGQPYVGDSLKDLRAAEATGCEPVLVMTGNGAETLQFRPHHKPVFEDLMAFVKNIITI